MKNSRVHLANKASGINDSRLKKFLIDLVDSSLLIVDNGIPSTVGHDHDFRYYTKAESNFRFYTNTFIDANFTPKERSITLLGTDYQVLIGSLNTQDLSANRSWTFSLPQNIHTLATPQFAKIGIGTSVHNEALIDINAYSSLITKRIINATGFKNGPLEVFRGSNTNTSGSSFFSLNETSNNNVSQFYIERNGSTHPLLANAVNIWNVNSGDLRFATNNILRVSISSTGTTTFHGDIIANSGVIRGRVLGTEKYILATDDFVTAGFAGDTNLYVYGNNKLFFSINSSKILTITGGLVSSAVSISSASTIQGTRLISTVASGISPLSVVSSSLVSNLNADLLDGFHSSSFALDSTVVHKDGPEVITGTKTFSAITYYYSLQRNSFSANGSHANPIYDNAISQGSITNQSSIKFGNSFNSNHGTWIKFIVNSLTGASSPIDALIISPYGDVNVFSDVNWGNGSGSLSSDSSRVIFKAFLLKSFSIYTGGAERFNIHNSTGDGVFGANFTAANFVSVTGMFHGKSGAVNKFILATDDLVTAGFSGDTNLYVYGNNKLFFSINSSKILTITGGLVSSAVSISSASTIQGTRLISTVASGTSPLSVVSSSLVSNLNADLLDGFHGSYYLSRTNHTGTQTSLTISDFDLAAINALSGLYVDVHSPQTVDGLKSFPAGIVTVTADFAYYFKTVDNKLSWDDAFEFYNGAALAVVRGATPIGPNDFVTKDYFELYSVPNSRVLNTSTGLTGGGLLSSNLTLALDTAFTDSRYIINQNILEQAANLYITSVRANTLRVNSNITLNSPGEFVSGEFSVIVREDVSGLLRTKDVSYFNSQALSSVTYKGNSTEDDIKARRYFANHYNSVVNSNLGLPSNVSIPASARFILYSEIGYQTILGMGSGYSMWFQVGSSTWGGYQWYYGTSLIASLSTNGNLGIIGQLTIGNIPAVGDAVYFLTEDFGQVRKISKSLLDQKAVTECWIENEHELNLGDEWLEILPSGFGVSFDFETSQYIGKNSKLFQCVAALTVLTSEEAEIQISYLINGGVETKSTQTFSTLSESKYIIPLTMNCSLNENDKVTIAFRSNNSISLKIFSLNFNIHEIMPSAILT